MRHPPTQAEGAEVAQIDAVIGECLVKLDHQRFVFGADRADDNLISILHGPGRDIL